MDLQLIVGGPTQLITSEELGRTFEVALIPGNKYYIVDQDTDKDYKIEVESIDLLQKNNFEEIEAIILITYLRDLLNGILKSPELAEIIAKISETYSSPRWLMGELQNLSVADLLTIVKSDFPAEEFKKFI